MSLTRLAPLTALLALSGCVYHTRENVDEVVCNMALRPYDAAPPGQAEPPKPPAADDRASSGYPGDRQNASRFGPTDVLTTAYMQGDKPGEPNKVLERLKIPAGIPGSWRELPKLTDKEGKPLPPEERRRILNELFPPLEALPPEPVAQPGPGGQPYTLTQLQRLGTQFSAAYKQAASDVEFARGNLLQSRAYPNPTFSYAHQPSTTGFGPTIEQVGLDQLIKTGGKLQLQEAAARMDLFNAELALRRARSDLSTQVRNAYCALLVAKETMRVNRAVARLTDAVYRSFVDLAASDLAALSEPAALQAQAEVARLAYVQSVKTYDFAWKQLVAAIGLRDRTMPLSEVAGRIDAFVPRYSYDQVLARVLTGHTDILIAQNAVQKAKYNLKLAEVTPWSPDLDVAVTLVKDYTQPPGTILPGISIGAPLPVWDQNKGNIIAAEAALVRALEQQHAAEQTWTTTVTTSFVGYENTIKGLEYYRRIVPELVLAYRGVLFRRATLGGTGRTPFAFADLVTAQQALTAGVASYLALLGQVWTSAVSVADPLQTDDLFQMGRPEALPPIPDLEHLPPLPCAHDCPGHPGTEPGGCAPAGAAPVMAPAPSPGQLPATKSPPESAATVPVLWPVPARAEEVPLGPAPVAPAAAFGPGASPALPSRPRPGGMEP